MREVDPQRADEDDEKRQATHQRPQHHCLIPDQRGLLIGDAPLLLGDGAVVSVDCPTEFSVQQFGAVLRQIAECSCG